LPLKKGEKKRETHCVHQFNLKENLRRGKEDKPDRTIPPKSVKKSEESENFWGKNQGAGPQGLMKVKKEKSMV